VKSGGVLCARSIEPFEGGRWRLRRMRASSSRGPRYLAQAKALSVGLSNAYFKSLGLPPLYDRLVDGRWFRILTVVDQYTRECLCAHADRSQTGEKVAEELERVIALRGAPETITSDNGSEFAGQAMDYWAHQSGVKLDFIRPGKPVENSYIESFNGRLRDECLNVEVFLDLADAQSKIQSPAPTQRTGRSNAAGICPCDDATLLRPFRSGKAEGPHS
jgi:putative transposase